VGSMGPNTLRCVTHLNVDTDGARRAASVIAQVLTA
jgi:hypothetical protein